MGYLSYLLVRKKSYSFSMHCVRYHRVRVSYMNDNCRRAFWNQNKESKMNWRQQVNPNGYIRDPKFLSVNHSISKQKWQRKPYGFVILFLFFLVMLGTLLIRLRYFEVLAVVSTDQTMQKPFCSIRNHYRCSAIDK